MSTADLSHLPPVSSLPSGLAQPPGRRGRRWSFDAALPLFTSTVKHAAPKAGRSRSRSVVGPESIFVPPTLTEKHEGFIQKNWRKLQKRRNSFSSANKDFIIVANCEDDSTHVLSGGDGRTVRDVLNSARHMELRINSYRVIMSSSRSSLPSFTASMSMSESLEDLFEELQDDDSKEHLLATDGRYATLHNLLEGERIYQQNLRTIFDTYAEPLRKFSALNKDDHRALFSGVEPLLSLSIMLSSKLEDALRQWDPGTAYLSGFFSKKFWEQYEEYVNSYPLTADYLREKRTNDDSFSEFCELRRGTSGQSLEELLYLPVRRLPRYEQQLRELREETDPAHPDYDDLTRAINKVKEMVVEHDMIVDGGVESIQGRFPYDDLHLTQRDSPAVSTLQRRRRSAPSAFLLKTLGSSRSRSAGNLLSTSGTPFRKEDFIQAARLTSGRYFIKEGPVQLTSQGVQAQDRYLFLFNDVLLIAKPKSGSTYKLKQRVRVCELWTAGCVEEVCDSPRFLQQSFVLGWPITNQVVTCHTQQDKHTWLQSLNSQIEEERKKLEQRSVTVTVNGGEELEQMKEIDINIRQDAKELLKMYVDKCQVSESESKDFQLWVMPGREDTAFPLIGHEIPYSICCHGDEGETEPTQFRFFVKNKKASKRQGLDEGRKQKGKTFLSLFKRSSRDSMETCPPLKLFGQPLEAVMVEDELPKPVMTLLSMLCLHGPHTHGILRKSANEKLKKELRQRLDDGEDCITNDTSLHIVGALVKDYLRSLPESVLQDDLYDEWTATEQITDTAERVTALKQLCQQLPTCNLVLLRHVMCVLYHIERHSEWSSMDASNLATCVAQSMLRSKGTGTLQPSAVMKANNLLQFMIENCVEIFGEETTLLLECAEEKPDSGTDTDSIPETNGNLRRDDSSLDSLEKDDPQDMESGSRRAKSHLSPVNLSNDSGVTLSDNQLVSDESHYNDNMRSHSLRHHRNSHNYVSKRHSADSLCSVEESSETEEQSEHFKHCSYRAIMKSTSGDHLFPTSRDSHSTEALSDSEIQTTRPRDRLMRQSSVISSTPPLSPQPKLSYSSDSLLSDSSASYLRENSGFSGDSPRHCFHPDQHYGQTFSQTITVNHEGSKQMLEKSNSDNTVPVSRHRPPQRRYSDESINYHVSPPSSPKTGRQQRGSSPPSPIHQSTSPSNSHKNNTHRHSVHSYLPPQDTHVPKGYESNESHVPKPSLSLVQFSSEDSTDGPENRSSRKPVDHHLLSQTRPPRILLQTYCQRRSSEQEAQQLPLSSSHSSSQDSNKMEIDSVNQHKSQDNKEQMPLYESRTVSVTRKKHNVIKIKSNSATPKPSPTPVQPQYLSQVTVRTRPEHPPSYQEALDRKERISKGLPVDVSLQDTLSQKRASAHAKQLYEQSLKQFIKDAPSSTVKTSFSSSSTSSEEDFLPEKDPKKVYEESMRRFLEQQQSSTCATPSDSRVSNEVSSKSTRSNSVGIVGSQGQTYIGVGGSQVEKHVCGLGNQRQTRVTIGGDSQRYRSHNFPSMPDHRTVIHIPSVRDSKLVEMRNRGLTSVSNSYSRTSRPGTHNPASGYFYNPKPRSSVEGSTKSNFSSSGGGSRISVNPRQPPSESSKTYHSTSDLSELSQQNKPGLSWSVADLRRNYQNPRSDPSHARPKSTHIVTVGGHDYDGSNKRPPPPPYNPPPPFRRNSDTARQSSSSSSSRGSTDGSGSSTSHTIRNNYSPQ